MTRRFHDEGGSVLIITVAVTGILSLLVGVAFTVARTSISIADDTQRTHGGLAAAEAGLDDYIFRLNNVDEYWLYDEVTAAPDGNTAFVADASDYAAIGGVSWTPVPGGGAYGEYVYSVDVSELPTDGVIRITATGRVVPPGSLASGDPAIMRTVTGTVKQNSFLDFLYFTNFETLDPISYSTTADQAWAQTNCSRRRWVQERPSTGLPSNLTQGCKEITWALGDRVNGPFHTNDRWRVAGSPTWEADVSGSANDGNFYTGSATPVFNGGDPFYQAPLEMPPSNAALKIEADYTRAGEGCLYTGPTAIVLNSNGTMTIDSPYTRETGTGCGTFSGSGNDPPQSVPIPTNGVVYIQAVPAASGDVNYTAAGCPFGNNGLGYPISNDANTYNCRDGAAFVEGTLDGRLTIGTENSIIITWHLLYAGTDDMLGLIANDFVRIYHPVNPSVSRDSQNLNALPNHNAKFVNPQINAAILAVSHSFMVQRWADGNSSLGTITLNGAIAQIYRGPVGTFSGSSQYSGYDKNYNYDQRLRYTNPPHFIDPVKASWRIVQFAEQFPN